MAATVTRESLRTRYAAGGRRADLQGMRAVAVLTVFADHLFSWPTGGFVGVDVFFVLSGFFITGILIRERVTTRHVSFRRFYVRRVRRIIPSALLVLVVTVICALLLFTKTRAKETILDALYAAVFAANFRFEAVGADYFQSSQPPSPLQHYWSLSIEEQFYFVWPALIVAIFAATRSYRQRGKKSAGQWGLLAAMGVIVAASFGWAWYLAVADPNAAYFSTFTRVWELGVGALVAIVGPWLLDMRSALRPILAYAGLAGVIASLFVINPDTQWPAPWAALPVLSTALVAASFHGAEVRGMFLLTNPVARWFGDTSYTLYLWHWPVITLLFAVMPKGPVFYAISIVVAIGLTAVTYHFYENPLRHSNWLLEAPAKRTRHKQRIPQWAWGLTGGLAAATAVLTILYLGQADKIAAARQSMGVAGARQNEVVNFIQTDPCFGAAALQAQGCETGGALEPSIDEFTQDAPDAVFSNCFRPKGATSAKIEKCDYGYMEPGATRIAIVGDSHAASFLPALWGTAEANKWWLTTYLGWNCQLIDPLQGQCATAMTQAAADILAAHYDLVIVTGSNGGYGKPETYAQALAPIVASGSRVAVVLDNPWPSDDALACLTRGRPAECSTSQAAAFPRPDPLAGAAQLVPGISVIDLTPMYCVDNRCPAVIGNVIVYRDNGGHVTATYMSTLSKAVADNVKQILGTKSTTGS